jgi:hypothetical protein
MNYLTALVKFEILISKPGTRPDTIGMGVTIGNKFETNSKLKGSKLKEI